MMESNSLLDQFVSALKANEVSTSTQGLCRDKSFTRSVTNQPEETALSKPYL